MITKSNEMISYENRFGRYFFAPGKPGVHVDMDDNGFFIRWQFETGDSMMSDESLAEVCDLSKEAYIDKLIGFGAEKLKAGVYFNNRENCQNAIDQLVAPAVLLRILEINKITNEFGQ